MKPSGKAIEKGIIKSTAIIVDSTHTNAIVRPKSIIQVLRELSKQLRHEIYREMVEISEKFPEKLDKTAELAEEIEYTYRLLKSVGTEILQSENSNLIELYEHIKELLDTGRFVKFAQKMMRMQSLVIRRQTAHFLDTKII